jgi:hypothetical protein
MAASVSAAVSFLVLFLLIAAEMMHIGKQPVQQTSGVWKDLEDAEEEWERKK